MSARRIVKGLFLLGVLAPVRVYASPPSVDLRTDFDMAQADFDEAQQLQLDRPDRARHLFRSAAQRFDGIVAAGVVNGRLEYNLANCHLQAGDVGHAILHYRRAQRLIPGNEMLADNLAVARSRCLTAIPPTPRSAFLKSVFFWHYQTSVGGRTKTALLAYIGVWVLLIVYDPIRRREPADKTTPATRVSYHRARARCWVAAVVCAVLAATAGVSVGMTRWSDRNIPEGVVTAMDVAVYKGPGGGYKRQFEQPLQPGAEFTLRERRGGWCKIELADGKSGWIEAAQMELVPDNTEKERA
jgi:hypothetical protein